MNEKLISKYIRLEERLNRYVGFKAQLLMAIYHIDSMEACNKARSSKKANKLNIAIYNLKMPIKRELKESHYFVPYDLLEGERRYMIKSIRGDKKRVMAIYTSKDYIEPYLLYEELSLPLLYTFLNRYRISKIILNPNTLNVVLSKSSLKEPVGVIITKNKLRLE